MHKKCKSPGIISKLNLVSIIGAILINWKTGGDTKNCVNARYIARKVKTTLSDSFINSEGFTGSRY